MDKKKEETGMAVRKEDLEKPKTTSRSERKVLIRAIGNKVCDRNDEALRRLSKS